MEIFCMKGNGKKMSQMVKGDINFFKMIGGTKVNFKRGIFMGKGKSNLIIKSFTRETFRILS